MQEKRGRKESVPTTDLPEWQESSLRERKRVADWPELDRKMAIIARMTSDPPAEPRTE